jgi:hypothetical protein
MKRNKQQGITHRNFIKKTGIAVAAVGLGAACLPGSATIPLLPPLHTTEPDS